MSRSTVHVEGTASMLRRPKRITLGAGLIAACFGTLLTGVVVLASHHPSAIFVRCADHLRVVLALCVDQTVTCGLYTSRAAVFLDVQDALVRNLVVFIGQKKILAVVIEHPAALIITA